jgi:hypothetical protein
VPPLHECAAESIANPAAAESALEPLPFVVDPAAVGATPAETYRLWCSGLNP